MRNILTLLFLALLCAGFASCRNATEKYQNSRDNIVDVSGKLVKIPVGDLLFSWAGTPYIFGEYLVIADSQSADGQINIFDKNDFKPIITKAIRIGRGPGEIVNLGNVAMNVSRRELYLSDHGRSEILSCNIDSLIANPDYVPGVKMDMGKMMFPSKYTYINDALSIARIIEPTSSFPNYQTWAGKLNMITGEVEILPYRHPDTQAKNALYAASPEHGLYAEFYSYYDLITIGTLDGKLVCNIYGPKWDPETSFDVSYYGEGVFCGDKLLAAYSGKSDSEDRSTGLPTELLVFDLDGDYLKTLELGHKVSRFAYDGDNDRLIIKFNDEMEFAYLPLEGLLN